MHPTPNHIPPAGHIRAADFQAALALASADPNCFVEVFVTSWADVDRHRALAAQLGLAGRIGIHHTSALDALVDLRVLPGPPSGHPSTGRDVLDRLDRFIRAAGSMFAARFTIVLTN